MSSASSAHYVFLEYVFERRCKDTRNLGGDIGLIEFLSQLQTRVYDIRKRLCNQLEEGGVESTRVECNALREAYRALEEAKQSAEGLLRDFSELLLRISSSHAYQLEATLLGLNAIRDEIAKLYWLLYKVMNIVSLLEEYITKRYDLIAMFDPRRVELGVVENIKSLRRLLEAGICSSIYTILLGLEKIRKYYEARGRLPIFSLYNIVFGELAFILALL